MSRYSATYQTYINLVIEVDADDEDEAAEKSHELGEEYLSTVYGNSRGVRAEATLDGVGADEVEELTTR